MVGHIRATGENEIDLTAICQYLAARAPLEDLPLDWEASVYTSDEFGRNVGKLNCPLWSGERPTEEEVTVIAHLLDVRKGSRVLDVACGCGRHCQVLSRDYGARVTGVDISGRAIAQAKLSAEEAGLTIDYRAEDARHMSFDDEFDGALIAFNSFSLFSPDDAPGVLENIHRALRPAGRLFVDLDNKPFNCRYGVADASWEAVPGGLKLQEVHFHADVSVEVCRDIYFIVNSRPAEAVMFKRLYARDEISRVLLQCGYLAEQAYGGWDLSPLGKNSPKIILLAIKR